MCVVKLNLLKNGGFQLDIIISSLLYFFFSPAVIVSEVLLVNDDGIYSLYTMT